MRLPWSNVSRPLTISLIDGIYLSGMTCFITIRTFALFVLLALGVINVKTCLSAISTGISCTESQCDDTQRPGQDHPEENDSEHCCGQVGHCGHASAMLFGRPSHIFPSQPDKRLYDDELTALDGPVFGIDRPPQIA